MTDLEKPPLGGGCLRFTRKTGSCRRAPAVVRFWCCTRLGTVY